MSFTFSLPPTSPTTPKVGTGGEGPGDPCPLSHSLEVLRTRDLRRDPIPRVDTEGLGLDSRILELCPTGSRWTVNRVLCGDRSPVSGSGIGSWSQVGATSPEFRSGKKGGRNRSKDLPSTVYISLFQRKLRVSGTR